MELLEKAQSSSDFWTTDNRETDIMVVGRRKSRLAAWKLLHQVKQCHQREELLATAVILACGGLLALLLAIANITDRIMDIARRDR